MDLKLQRDGQIVHAIVIKRGVGDGMITGYRGNSSVRELMASRETGAVCLSRRPLIVSASTDILGTIRLRY
jgi:hypothetical protein